MNNHPFKVSDKVVYVDDRALPHRLKFVPCRPKLGVVYVVREIRFGNTKPLPACLLVGLHNPINSWTGREQGFYSFRFRKLDELKEENRLKRQQEVTV